MLEQLLIQNSCRWGHCDPAVREFLRSAMPNLARAGLARVTVLSIAGSLAAICLALQDQKHRLMFYMSGFEPAVAHVSPGSLLVGAMIDEAISLGRREIHFLRGGEAYKYAWGAEDRWNISRRLKRRSADGPADGLEPRNYATGPE